VDRVRRGQGAPIAGDVLPQPLPVHADPLQMRAVVPGIVVEKNRAGPGQEPGELRAPAKLLRAGQLARHVGVDGEDHGGSLLLRLPHGGDGQPKIGSALALKAERALSEILSGPERLHRGKKAGPVLGVDMPGRVRAHPLLQLRPGVAGSVAETAADGAQLRTALRREAEQAAAARRVFKKAAEPGAQILHLAEGGGKLLLLPALAVDVQNQRAEYGGRAVRGAYRPQRHPHRRAGLAEKPKLVLHRLGAADCVQQALQQPRPVLGADKRREIGGKPVQKFPAGIAGKLAQPLIGGDAAHPAAHLHQRDSAGKTVRQRIGRWAADHGSSGAPFLQNAGAEPVHRLITGNGELPPPHRLIGKGRGGAGERHRREGSQPLQGLRRADIAQPLALQGLGRGGQQLRGGRVGKAADEIHRLAAAVGDDFRQQEGNAAVLKGPRKIVEPLGHLPASPFRVKTPRIEQQIGARPFLRRAEGPAGIAAARFGPLDYRELPGRLQRKSSRA